MTELEQARLEINEADEKMAALFVRRMACAKKAGDYKRKNGLPIEDLKREADVISRNAEAVPEELRKYYVNFLRAVFRISKEYQNDRAGE